MAIVLNTATGKLDLAMLEAGDILACLENVGAVVPSESQIEAIKRSGNSEEFAAVGARIRGRCGMCSKECPLYGL